MGQIVGSRGSLSSPTTRKRLTRVLALDLQQPVHHEGQARGQARVDAAADDLEILAPRGAPVVGGRPQGRAGTVVGDPHLLVDEQLAQTRTVKALEHALTQPCKEVLAWA